MEKGIKLVRINFKKVTKGFDMARQYFIIIT